MAIAENIFEKCLPAIGTSINSCGALTECDIVTATPDELEEIFQDDSGDFRDMSSLLMTQFEIRACGARQNGLFDFLMANAKPMKNRTIKTPLGFGSTDIAPFVMAEQTSVINDQYWTIKESAANGSDITFNLQSPGNAALDLSYFPDDLRVFVFGTSAGGSAIRGSYKVTDAALSTYSGSPSILITTVTQNAGSFLPSAKKGRPSTGFLVIGTPNIADVERWCNNRPALNDRKHVPFWFETNRYTLCVDELYERAFERLRKTNDYFRLFGDVDVARRNKQLGERFQKEWVNQVFWGKASNANQTLANYRSLPNITSYQSSTFDLGTENKCVGRKADVIGIYEQLAQCNRIADLQGQQLNLVEFFNDIVYPIHRSRKDQGRPSADIIEVLTDSYYASLFQRGMILYYNDQSEGLARFMIDTKKVMTGQKGELGFSYDTYDLIYPAGVTLRILTHDFFDDFQQQAATSGNPTSGRMLWILDWSGIYPGIIASNRAVHKTGDINDLAKIDSSYACVLANPTSEVTLNSLTFTVVVECPSDSIIVEGIGSYIPDYRGESATPSSDDYYTTYGS